MSFVSFTNPYFCLQVSAELMNLYYKKVLKVRNSSLNLLFVQHVPYGHLVYTVAVRWETGPSVHMRVFLALARLLCLLMYLALTKNITLCIPIIFLGSFVLRLNTHSILVSVGNWQDGATAVCVWILGQMVSTVPRKHLYNCSTWQRIGPWNFFCPLEYWEHVLWLFSFDKYVSSVFILEVRKGRTFSGGHAAFCKYPANVICYKFICKHHNPHSWFIFCKKLDHLPDPFCTWMQVI